MMLLSGLVIAGGALAAGETLSRAAMLGGGGRVAAGPVTLHAAVAQPVAGRAAAGETSHCAGIACAASAPPALEIRVYLPVVSR